MKYEVPCQIGQLVYCIQNGKKLVYEVEEINIKKTGVTVLLYNPAAPVVRRTVKAEAFGTTIFPYDRKEEEKNTEKHPSSFSTYVHGYSDDIVLIHRKSRIIFEINCFKEDVKIFFKDGTVVKVTYGKDGAGIWCINVEEKGTANQFLHVYKGESDEIYSDIFMINADIDHYEKSPAD